MKKDLPYIIGFILIGLLIAYLTGGPLRQPRTERGVGTPLQSAPIYAEGVVRVSPDIEDAARKMVALFIVARAQEQGPPLAVRRYEFPAFPLSYQLTSEHNMAAGDFYSGEIRIIAQLDEDGLAGRGPRDFEATVQLHSGATRNVDILITDR